MEPISLLIADDHPLFRKGVRALLLDAAEFEIAGEAATGEQAIAMAAELQPDVILMDVQMPGVNGIEATRRIVNTSPHIAVLVLTMFEDDDSVFAAMRAGARGYMLKGADQDQLLPAIRALPRGEAIFGSGIAQRVLSYFAAVKTEMPPQTLAELTDREREILELVAQGMTNTEIAARFVLSQKTVRNHVSNIFSKLQVTDRAQAVARARDAGFGQSRAGT